MVHRSVLDLALVSDGSTSGQALADTTRLAQHAERLGFRRFWVAEHHNMPTVASTAPAVLIAHVAAVTDTIRVGSGGVMLPNHAELAVAEQFAMLEALHPGRIDLGIGRAPGTDPATAAALRRAPDLDAEDFPRQLLDLMAMLGDRRIASGPGVRFTATPVATSRPEIMLLGSSGYSAELAGRLGLGFAFAHHFDVPGTLEAVAWYRRHFEPSPVLDEPYTIVTAGVLAADDAEQAEYLAGPARLAILGIRTGRRMPLLSPEAAARHPDLELARSLPSNRIVGDAAHVAAALAELVERTAADEIMVSTMTHGFAERAQSLELVAP
jgi:luciferase family oxidoreductase group 1